MPSHPAKGQPTESSPGVCSSHPSTTPYPLNPSHQPTNTVHHGSVESPQAFRENSSYVGLEKGFPTNWVDQLQLALAIANPELLQQLVLHCQSPLVAPHQLGAISAAVSVPVEGSQAADSVLSLEIISCQLVNNGFESDQIVTSKAASPQASGHVSVPLESPASSAIHRALVNQISRETKLQTLGMNIPLPEAIALLQYATFSLSDIQRILNLSYNGWHRSWWSMLDPTVNQTALSNPADRVGFTIPFKRLIRSRRYADGTVMLQYKDQFAYMPPPCFRTEHKSVLVHIQRPNQSISETLGWMNHAQACTQCDYGLLLYHQLSPLEQQAFLNQGIYLYHCASSESNVLSQSSRRGVTNRAIVEHGVVAHTAEYNTASASPTVHREDGNILRLADCASCHQQDCPMHGQEDSPVMTCRLFGV